LNAFLVTGWSNRLSFVAASATAMMFGFLATCGGVTEPRVGTDERRFFVRGRTLQSSDGIDPLFSYTLTAANDGALLKTGSERYPVVWPSEIFLIGTDPLVIKLPSREQARLGDEIKGGSGYLGAEHLGIDIPDVCLNEYGEVAVFNPDGDPAIQTD